MSLQAFRTFQFNAIGGKVDVKFRDWGLAAKLDSRFPYAIVAIVLHQYLTECPPPGSSQLEMITPRPLNQKHIDALLADNGPVANVDTALRSFLSTYNPPASSTYKQKLSEVLTLRATVFGDFGRLLLKIGCAFSEGMVKKTREIHSAGGRCEAVVLNPAERTEALANARLNVEHSFYKIEKKFREAMVKTGIYDNENPIQATFLYPLWKRRRRRIRSRRRRGRGRRRHMSRKRCQPRPFKRREMGLAATS